MKLSEIKTILKATTLTGDEHLERTITAGGAADLMDDILASAAKGAVLLTGLTTEHTLRTAKVARVEAIVFVRGKRPSQALIEMGREFDIPLFLTEYSLFVSCGRLYIAGLRGLDGSW
jgi:predicted transcriptional regulator